MRDKGYETQVQEFVDGHRGVYIPPKQWSWLEPVTSYYESLRRGYADPPKLDSTQTQDYAAFNAWYALVRSDFNLLIKLLDQSRLDRDIERRHRLLAVSIHLRERYKSAAERGRIAWLPLDSARYVDRIRTRCTVLDALGSALMRAECAPNDVEAIGEWAEHGWSYFERERPDQQPDRRLLSADI